MKLNQLTIDVSDIQRSKSFYVTLGFRLLVDSAHYCRFLAPDGDTTFSIHVTDGPINTGATFYLETNDVDGEMGRLAASGVRFDTAARDESWLWREAAFHDPDGHRWKLYHAGENRIDPPWRIKPEDD